MDAPSKKPRKRKSGGKGTNVIRSFFTFIFIFALIGLSIFNYLQVVQLKQANTQLSAANLQLKRELAKRRPGRVPEVRNHKTADVAVDPVLDAQVHLGRAESALTIGNVGVAMSECKLAGNDIQIASVSTSDSIQSNVSNLKARLGVVQKQTTALWHKLGAS